MKTSAASAAISVVVAIFCHNSPAYSQETYPEIVVPEPSEISWILLEGKIDHFGKRLGSEEFFLQFKPDPYEHRRPASSPCPPSYFWIGAATTCEKLVDGKRVAASFSDFLEGQIVEVHSPRMTPEGWYRPDSILLWTTTSKQKTIMLDGACAP